MPAVHRYSLFFLLAVSFERGGIKIEVMKKINMEVVSNNKGKVVNLEQDDFLKEAPAPPTYLTSVGKKYFSRNAEILIKAKRLKTLHVEALVILADNLAQKEWAIRAIAKRNAKKKGSGYIQKYATGATNITTELVVRRDAEKRIMECLTLFGMDPKSDKALGSNTTGQLSLFEELQKQMSGTN